MGKEVAESPRTRADRRVRPYFSGSHIRSDFAGIQPKPQTVATGYGTIATASISTLASSSNNPLTSASVIAG